MCFKRFQNPAVPVFLLSRFAPLCFSCLQLTVEFDNNSYIHLYLSKYSTQIFIYDIVYLLYLYLTKDFRIFINVANITRSLNPENVQLYYVHDTYTHTLLIQIDRQPLFYIGICKSRVQKADVLLYCLLFKNTRYGYSGFRKPFISFIFLETCLFYFSRTDV